MLSPDRSMADYAADRSPRESKANIFVETVVALAPKQPQTTGVDLCFLYIQIECKFFLGRSSFASREQSWSRTPLYEGCPHESEVSCGTARYPRQVLDSNGERSNLSCTHRKHHPNAIKQQHVVGARAFLNAETNQQAHLNGLGSACTRALHRRSGQPR